MTTQPRLHKKGFGIVHSKIYTRINIYQSKELLIFITYRSPLGIARAPTAHNKPFHITINTNKQGLVHFVHSRVLVCPK